MKNDGKKARNYAIDLRDARFARYGKRAARDAKRAKKAAHKASRAAGKEEERIVCESCGRDTVLNMARRCEDCDW